MQPKRRRYIYLRVSDIFVVLAFFIITQGNFAHFADDPGVGWHLKTGEHILDTSTVPRHDPFLFSPTPRPWIADQWLSDTVLALLFRLGDWELVYGFLSALFMITFMVIGHATNTRWSGSPLAASFAALVALKLATVHFILRPVIFAFFLFALVCYFCYDAVTRIRRGGKLDISPFIILPLLFLAWSNLHPSFVMGLYLLGTTAITLLYEAVFVTRSAAARSPVIQICALTGVCTALTFINPYGADLHKQIFDLGRSSYFMNLNQEWLPINMRSPEGTVFLYTSLLIFTGALLRKGSHHTWKFFEYTVFCSFFYFTSRSLRFLPFFGLVVAPLVADACSSLGELFLKLGGTAAKRVQTLWARVEERERTLSRGYLLTTLICAIISLSPWSSFTRKAFPLHLGPSEARYPYGALSYIKAHTPPDSIAVVAATPDWGGFITWAGFPNIKPIIDDRNSLLGEDFYIRFLAALKSSDQAADTFHELRATYVLVPAQDPLVEKIKSLGDMTLLYEDRISVLLTWHPSVGR